MVTSLKQKAAVGAAGVALLAGAGGAYAATRSSPAPGVAKSRAKITAQRNAFLDDVAKRLGTTRAKLEAALKGAAVDRIDAAVAAGQPHQGAGRQAQAADPVGQGPVPRPRPGGQGRPPARPVAGSASASGSASGPAAASTRPRTTSA